jgi:hypothetical protein
MLLKNDVYIQCSEYPKWCLPWGFYSKHYVKPHIFKMAPLPLKTLIREKNARVWSVYSRQEQGNLRSFTTRHF